MTPVGRPGSQPDPGRGNGAVPGSLPKSPHLVSRASGLTNRKLDRRRPVGLSEMEDRVAPASPASGDVGNQPLTPRP